jgi:hypothetical protein
MQKHESGKPLFFFFCWYDVCILCMIFQQEEEEEETWWVEERERERRERVCVVGGKGQAKHNENTPQKGQVNQPKSPFFLCFFP